MAYYKIISAGQVIDAVVDPVWVKHDSKGNMVRCDVSEAQGIVSGDGETVHWIDDVTGVADIDEAEYSELQIVLDMCGTISDISEEITWGETEEFIVTPDDGLLTIRQRKIDLLREDCQKEILIGIEHRMDTSGDLTDAYEAVQDQFVEQCVRLNCLIKWVNSCKTIYEMGAIEFDSDIPEEYQSEAFRKLAE